MDYIRHPTLHALTCCDAVPEATCTEAILSTAKPRKTLSAMLGRGICVSESILRIFRTSASMTSRINTDDALLPK